METSIHPVANCDVCCAPRARSCYGAIVCSSCRVFFIRTARKDPLKCSKFNNCYISSKSRLNCSACRYKKCLQAKMIPGDVGKREREYHSVVSYFNSLHYESRKSELSLCLLPIGLKAISQLEHVSTIIEFANILVHFDTIAINVDGKSPSDVSVNIDISLGDVLLNPELCSSREAAGWDAGETIDPHKIYSFQHTYCRHATLLADFLNSIPQFHELCLIDKIRLFQQSYCNFALFSMYYSQWKLKRTKENAKSRVDRFDFTEDERKRTISIVLIKNIHPLLTDIKITDQEWVLLKVISTFYAPSYFTEEGERIVLATRTSYCSILGKLIDELHPKLTKEQKIVRFNKLMSITSQIKKLSLLGTQFYSAFVSHEHANLKGRLSFDIHMRQV